jgi:hypothetical protein
VFLLSEGAAAAPATRADVDLIVYLVGPEQEQ